VAPKKPPIDTTATQGGDPLAADFRNFLFVIWGHLGLPAPTGVQYDIARYLQHGPRRRVVMAFRGVGKSWITAAYVLWLLYRNADHKVMVVSASADRARHFSLFCKRLIEEVAHLQHLKPRPGQRTSLEAFDVGPAKTDQSPSVKSVGITGQLTGSRADTIVADDVEVANNSDTVGKREKLAEQVKEFDAVLKPGGEVVYLGTAQTEESLYTKQLEARGYEVRIWPVRYPTADQRTKYGSRLAPWITDQIFRGTPEGSPVEPTRFPDSEITERELSYGRAGFALQFMLDTALSDADRYPLRLRDLIVMSCHPRLAPVELHWGGGSEQVVPDLPQVGFTGDRWHRPFMVSKENWAPYQGVTMFIDPAGRGKDECAYAVVAMSRGMLFLLDCRGLTGGYSEENLRKLAEAAKRWGVKAIRVESNFGDGMFLRLLQPVLQQVYPCTTEEVRSSKQKELRIIDTLEPVLNRHLLVVDEALVREDASNYNQHPVEKAHQFALFWQLTHITREKGALLHDDRLDALAGATAYWTEQLGLDHEEAARRHRDGLLEKELEGFIDEATGGSSRGTLWFSLPRSEGVRIGSP
jgi:hypothetical protein